MFDLFIKQNVRLAFWKKDVSYEEAMSFLEYIPFSVVKDRAGNSYYTQEELKNAKSIRSEDSVRSDKDTSAGRSVSKDSDRKLSKTHTDRTKPRSKRDN